MLKVIRTANVVNFAAYNDIPLPVSPPNSRYCNQDAER